MDFMPIVHIFNGGDEEGLRKGFSSIVPRPIVGAAGARGPMPTKGVTVTVMTGAMPQRERLEGDLVA